MNLLGHIQQGGSPSPFDRICGCMLAVESMDYIYSLIRQNIESSGRIYATEHSSVCVLGLQGRNFKCTPVEELKKVTDFKLRISLDTWWTQLRLLMRLLTKNVENTFNNEESSESSILPRDD